MRLRSVLFWTHLILGLSAGLLIAVMAFTGATMAYEDQILAWSERAERRVTPPAPDSPRVSIDQLLRNLREDRPDFRVGTITVSADLHAAIVLLPARQQRPAAPTPSSELPKPTPASPSELPTPKSEIQNPKSPVPLYANPYTGEVSEGSAKTLRTFFAFNLRLHRWLGAQSQSARALGGQFTAAACAFFLLLTLSGLYLWWPRQFTWRHLRPTTVFNRKLTGKARDWNWHNVIGFWASPFLILITFTGLVMAYSWLGNLFYKRPEGEPAATTQITRPADGSRPLGPDALLAAIQKTIGNDWSEITLRLASNERQRGAMNSPRPTPSAPSPLGTPSSSSASVASAHPPSALPPPNSAIQNPASSLAPITASVRPLGWSLYPTQLSLHPYTGELLKTERLADYSFGRAFRTLNKTLHTGEAFGLLGQTFALLATLSTLALVYTGFALAWRRFFTR